MSYFSVNLSAVQYFFVQFNKFCSFIKFLLLFSILIGLLPTETNSLGTLGLGVPYSQLLSKVIFSKHQAKSGSFPTPKTLVKSTTNGLRILIVPEPSAVLLTINLGLSSKLLKIKPNFSYSFTFVEFAE